MRRDEDDRWAGGRPECRNHGPGWGGEVKTSNMNTISFRAQSGIRSRQRSAFRFVARLILFMVVAAMLPPMLPSPAAAQGSIPENVLASSVRIATNIVVTPDDGDDAFLCMLDEQTVLEYSVGSGTVITEDGYVLTNHHVADNGRIPRIVRDFCEDQAPGGDAETDWIQIGWLPDERGIPETPYLTELVRDSSMQIDLAVIQLAEQLDADDYSTNLEGDEIDEPFTYVEFGDSDALREPESIFIIGYPLNAGTSRRVSEGIFSGWGDNGFGVEWIYTDATISGGNSGGTAVNAEGLFVGIPTQATSDDCRPGDTNLDGKVDEDDGCIGIGGNYGILIPSNIARAFAEETLDINIPVVEADTTDQRADPTEEPDDTPVNTEDQPVGEITFNAYDADLEVLDEFEDVFRLEACFENYALENGDDLEIAWYLDGEVLYVTEASWDEAWNPVACAWIEITEDSDSDYLEPGTYFVEVTAHGETVTSEEVEIER
jgi:S1-C subfamily serine protease